MRFEVRVHPRSSRARVVREGGVFHVWVHPPAAGGAANRAALQALAAELGVAPARIRIVAGAHGRTKLVEVEG